MGKYAKALVATLTAALTAASQSLPDGKLKTAATLALPILGALAVLLVRNGPAPVTPPDPGVIGPRTY